MAATQPPTTARRVLLAALATPAPQAAAQHAAAPYRPARMIVPLPPGSSPDVAARLFAEGLSRRRGHPIAVENRVGGIGAVASNAFLQAKPGEALFFGMGDLLTEAPLTRAGTPFADAAAFVPISTAATVFMAVSVPASLPVRSLGEFVRYARAQPGALNWFAEPGTALYLALNAFLRRAGIEAVFVSFSGLMMPELVQVARPPGALGPLAGSRCGLAPSPARRLTRPASDRMQAVRMRYSPTPTPACRRASTPGSTRRPWPRRGWCG